MTSYADALRRSVDAADRFARSPRAAQELYQFAALAKLAAHAHRASPFWRERLEASGWSPGRAFDRATLERIPPLTRSELQQRADDIRARPVDPAWGKIVTASTSGSTGKPVSVDRIAVQSLHYDTVTAINHLWHQRDLSLKLVALRMGKRDQRRNDWGHPMALLARTGPSAGLISVGTTIESEYEAIQAEKPDYFITMPGRALGYANIAAARGGSPHRIREFITIGETVTPGLRDLVRRGFGAQIKDVYSTRDAGYLALQCRNHERYHVLAEHVLLEVVGEDGRAAAPGKPGKVLVTILHSLAMPIIRYDIGDVAVAGAERCDCGLTLPALDSILGRNRNLARLPDGQLRYVMFPGSRFLEIGPARDYRLIQRGPNLMEVYVEWGVPLDDAHRAGITRLVQDAMGFPIEVKVIQVPRVEHSSASKREEFVRIE
ncbi:MAG TPA: hypothetical protein VF943_06000 [Burkholderiales bacterium]